MWAFIMFANAHVHANTHVLKHMSSHAHECNYMHVCITPKPPIPLHTHTYTQRARLHICIHIHAQAHAQYRCVHYMHELVEKGSNNKSLCRREKWVLSFGIKEQSEEECLTVRGRGLTSDMIIWLLQWQFRTVMPAVCAFYWDFTDCFKVMVLMIAVWFSSRASPAFQCHIP